MGRTASPNVLGDPAGRVASPPTSWPTPGEAADQTVWLCGLPGMKFILTSDHSGSRHQQPRARSPRCLRRPRKGPSPSAQARGSERAGGPASCCPAQGPQTRCAKGQAPRHPRSLPSDLALPLRRGNSHGPRAREWGQRVLIKLYLHRQAVGQICPAGWGVSSWEHGPPAEVERGPAQKAVINPVAQRRVRPALDRVWSAGPLGSLSLGVGASQPAALPLVRSRGEARVGGLGG